MMVTQARIVVFHCFYQSSFLLRFHIHSSWAVSRSYNTSHTILYIYSHFFPFPFFPSSSCHLSSLISFSLSFPAWDISRWQQCASTRKSETKEWQTLHSQLGWSWHDNRYWHILCVSTVDHAVDHGSAYVYSECRTAETCMMFAVYCNIWWCVIVYLYVICLVESCACICCMDTVM